MSLEPRVRYQAQFWHPHLKEWWEAGHEEKSYGDAAANISRLKMFKTRILKTTTTFEVVEEMEPKQ